MSDESPVKPLLEQFLADRDAPCPCCKYNLRTLTGARCPECGQELVLTLGLVQPRMAAQIVGLVAIAIGVGFNGLFLLFAIWMSSMHGPPPDRERFFIFVVIPAELAIFIAILVGWLLTWRQLQSAGPARRWGLALTLWLLPVIDLVIFCASVR